MYCKEISFPDQMIMTHQCIHDTQFCFVFWQSQNACVVEVTLSVWHIDGAGAESFSTVFLHLLYLSLESESSWRVSYPLAMHSQHTHALDQLQNTQTQWSRSFSMGKDNSAWINSIISYSPTAEYGQFCSRSVIFFSPYFFKVETI